MTTTKTNANERFGFGQIFNTWCKKNKQFLVFGKCTIEYAPSYAHGKECAVATIDRDAKSNSDPCFQEQRAQLLETFANLKYETIDIAYIDILY